MDERTAALLDALERPAAAVLLELSEQGATEAHLVATLKGTTQATTNRRLLRLEQLGVIEREPGRTKAPGRKWSIVHPEPTNALLRAALALSEATAKGEARNRKDARKRLRRTRTNN